MDKILTKVFILELGSEYIKGMAACHERGLKFSARQELCGRGRIHFLRDPHRLCITPKIRGLETEWKGHPGS